MTSAIAQNGSIARSSDDGLKLLLGEKMLLESERDGFMSIHAVSYSPTGKYFVAIGCGFECTDNIGFLFRANGTRKREFTDRWDSIFQDKLEWSSDGKTLYYYRINSTGADPPKSAPKEGWVALDVNTLKKSPATSRRLDVGKSYVVFDAESLSVREAPGVKSKELGKIPLNSKGVVVSGPAKVVGASIWVPVVYKDLKGWVNQNYLFRSE